MSWLRTLFGEDTSNHELTPSPATGLAVYGTTWCGFCHRVYQTLDELGIADQVEIRDPDKNPAYRADLIKVRGTKTVPVLRIAKPDAEDEWLPESADIMAWLRRTHG